MHAVPQDLNKAVAEHEALRQVQGAAESESSGVAEAAPGQTEAQVSLEIANVEAQAAAELLAGAQQWAAGLAEALSVSQVRSFAFAEEVCVVHEAFGQPRLLRAVAWLNHHHHCYHQPSSS